MSSLLKSAARLAGFVQAVQFAALVKQRRFRRVHVFGLALIDHAAAESDDAAARIANRKHEPVAKPVVITEGLFTAALEDEAHLQKPAPFLVVRAKAF